VDAGDNPHLPLPRHGTDFVSWTRGPGLTSSNPLPGVVGSATISRFWLEGPLPGCSGVSTNGAQLLTIELPVTVELVVTHTKAGSAG